MKQIKKISAVILLVFFVLAPYSGFAQEDTFVNTEIQQNEGNPAGLPNGMMFGQPGPGGNPSGIPGGGQAVDVTASAINVIIAALSGTYLGPGIEGSFDANAMAQLFTGNPAYIRKYGSVKSGVFLDNGDFTWDVGDGLHLFGNLKNEDEVNNDFDFALRNNEHFRMDLSFGKLIDRSIWHSGDFGDYILDTRNWYNGTDPSIAPPGNDLNCANAPELCANGANPAQAFYMIYHNGMVMGQQMQMMNPMTGMMMNVPDYWMVGFGSPMPVGMKQAMEPAMRYTPLLDSDFRLETEFRPVDWLRGILGYNGFSEGGQDVQHLLTFVDDVAPGVMQTNLLPLPDPPFTPNPFVGFQAPSGGFLPDHPKFQWTSRQITMARDPLSNDTHDYEGGLDLMFNPVEVLAIHSQSDFTNNQIIDPYLQDLLNRPFGWDMNNTFMCGTPQGALWNSNSEVISNCMMAPGMNGTVAGTSPVPIQALYAFDAGYLIPDYRIEDNHWSENHLRVEVPLGSDPEDSLQFKLSTTEKYSDASYNNVTDIVGIATGLDPYGPPQSTAGGTFQDFILPDPSAAGTPAGMFQGYDPHRDFLQYPSFDRPQVSLTTFNFYAPLHFGDWHFIPNLDHVSYTSSSGIRSNPDYSYTKGGIELQNFGVRHSFSFDLSVENESQSALYDTRNVNTWDAANPVMNPGLQPGWLQFLQQIAFLYQNPSLTGPAPSPGPVPGGTPLSCAGGDNLGQDPGLGSCLGPMGSLGNINNIIANNPTQPVGLMSINSFKWDATARYTQRLSDTLDLRLNARLTHDNQPYYRTDPNDENREDGQLNWRPISNFFATVDYAYQNSRNDFLFPESTLQRRGSITADWQAGPNLNLNAGFYREDQGMNFQSPIIGSSITNGIFNPIIWWLVQAGVPPAYIQNLAINGTGCPATSPDCGNVAPTWASMYFLPDQNSVNSVYLNQNSTYNFGFSFNVNPESSLFGNWTHSAFTASYQINERIPSTLELPYDFQANQVLWGFNTPPNLDVVQNNVSLGFNWRKKEVVWSFLAGFAEYQDLNARLSRSQQFANGLTPPAGGIYATSLASFGFPVYPTMVSPDSGKVLYFNVSWTRHF